MHKCWYVGLLGSWGVVGVVGVGWGVGLLGKGKGGEKLRPLS